MANLAPLHIGQTVHNDLVLFQPIDPIDLVIFQPRFGLISTLLQPLVLFQPLIPCSYTLVFYASPTILGPLLQEHVTFHLKCHTQAGASQ